MHSKVNSETFLWKPDSTCLSFFRLHIFNAHTTTIDIPPPSVPHANMSTLMTFAFGHPTLASFHATGQQLRNLPWTLSRGTHNPCSHDSARCASRKELRGFWPNLNTPDTTQAPNHNCQNHGLVSLISSLLTATESHIEFLMSQYASAPYTHASLYAEMVSPLSLLERAKAHLTCFQVSRVEHPR